MEEFAGSIEFYAIMFAIAIAIVGFAMRPSEKGPAITAFAKGRITASATEQASVEAECLADGSLVVRRRGVWLDTPDCEINYSITITGSDIKISEKRVTAAFAELLPGATDIEFSFDPPRGTRYHLLIESEWSGEWASGTIRAIPGMTAKLAVHK